MPLFKVNGKIVHFVHIPKTGGTSFEKWFSARFASMFLNGKLEGVESTLQHLDSKQYPELFYGWPDYEFTVVRNPYDRIISAYRWRYAKSYGRGDYVPPFKLWLAFKLWLTKSNPRIDDNFYIPQTEFIREGTDVYKFEEGLEGAMVAVCNNIGVEFDGELPHFYKTKKMPVELDGWCLDKIAEVYSTDFAILKYSTDFLSRSGVNVYNRLDIKALIINEMTSGLPVACLKYVWRRISKK